MTNSTHLKTALLTLALVLTAVVGWELFWRSQGYRLAYNDDESLWASKRKLIYQSAPARPVLIGSSRIKFDLDLATWEGITGEKPIQLSLVGTSPRPVLTDLGNDPNFRGVLVVDVTEGLFFAPGGPPEIEANKRVKHYPTWSLSQQISFRINRLLEDHLLFLDEERLALKPLLSLLPITSRPGVFVFPNFPPKGEGTDPDRQTSFTEEFVADTVMQNQMKVIWGRLGALNSKRGIGGDTLLAVLNSVKQSVDQIRSRGGQVVFVRTPSDGPFRAAENQAYPRNLYWDRLLAHTNTPGIHYEDYPALRRYQCPEWSHL
ncbi:MAG: hypothetical protein H7Y12_15645, partial [Sphingobacteriaceae bacterium]|nr:hypothetical protein [Cytophagaceae bacterium]